jgi:hypothetical protein
MNKKIYLSVVAILAGMSAYAQSYYYKMDSTFSSDGIGYLRPAGGSANPYACKLNSDESVFLAGNVNGHTDFFLKLKSSGITDSLCGSYCISSTAPAGYPLDIHNLGGSRPGTYFAHTGMGGVVLKGSSKTVEMQVYDPNLVLVKGTCRYDDSTIIVCSDDFGSAVVASFRINAASGYAGASGVLTNCAYPHAGYVTKLNAIPSNRFKLTAIGRQTSGKIIVAGENTFNSSKDVFVARLNTNKLTLDSTFGVNGVVHISTGNDLTPGALIVGFNDDIYFNYAESGNVGYVSAFLPNGAVKTAFNSSSFNAKAPGVIKCYGLFRKFEMVDSMIIGANYGTYTGATTPLIQPGTCATAFSSKSGLPLNIFPAGSAPYGWTLNLADAGYISGHKDYQYVFTDISKNEEGNLLICGWRDSASVGFEGIAIKLMLKVGTLPTKIKEQSVKSDLRLYPNPATDFVKFELQDAGKASFYKIVAPDGRVLKNESCNTNQIDVRDLTPGMYFMYLYTADKEFVTRFSKL